MKKCDCEKIKSLSNEPAIEMTEKLTKIKDFPTEWKMLYQCPECQQYWELSYPAAGDVCCVEPELSKMSPEAAKSEYVL